MLGLTTPASSSKPASSTSSARLRFLPPAAKYFKKLKDKNLKKVFQDAVDAILEQPLLGEEKQGDLRGIRSYDIYYKKVNYELAYMLIGEAEEVREVREADADAETEEDEAEVVVVIMVIMAGPRENFYDELKRYLRG